MGKEVVAKKNKLGTKKEVRKEQKKLKRALELEARLIDRLKRLRETIILRNSNAVVVFRASKDNLPMITFRKYDRKKKKFERRTVPAIQPVATPKKQKRSSMVYKSLEDACERFEGYCCECGQKMKVHAHGIGYPVRIEVVSTACWSENCPKRGREMKFSGEQLVRPGPIVADKKERLGILLRLPSI